MMSTDSHIRASYRGAMLAGLLCGAAAFTALADCGDAAFPDGRHSVPLLGRTAKSDPGQHADCRQPHHHRESSARNGSPAAVEAVLPARTTLVELLSRRAACAAAADSRERSEPRALRRIAASFSGRRGPAHLGDAQHAILRL
jgi:hypothetical protein